MNPRVVCLPAHDFAFLGEGMKLAVVFFLPSLYNKGSRCPAAAPDRRRSLMKKRGWILGLAALTLLSGCGAFPAESGVTEAVLGETVSTRWFDCTVEEAEARKSYESDTASSGNKLVVVELELKNTFHEAVSMYDTDFQLYWGECGPDEWAMPLDPYCEDQLPREYDLEPGKSREGLLVYEVPQEETEFTLAFLELIENGTEEGEEGDLFLTRFTVE